jgi:hypothetical protein
LTITIEDGPILDERNKVLHESFKRYLDIRLGIRNRPKFLTLARDYVIEHYSEKLATGDVTSAEYTEKIADWDRSLMLFDKRLGRINKTLRLRDLIGKGIADYECTFTDKGLWHPHRHLILETKFLPWPYLAVLWRIATRDQGHIVDIRPMSANERERKEQFKYVTKPWEIPEDKREEFREAVRGIKRIWPLGGSKPVKVDNVCPFCGKNTCHGRIVGMGESCQVMRVGDWEVLKVQIGEGIAAKNIYFVKVEGTWTDAKPEALSLILSELECHSEPAPPVYLPQFFPM